MALAAAIPVAKVAAPFILKGIGKLFGNKGKKKAEKERQRAQKEAIENKFAADTAAFNNREDDRLARTQGFANQLKGARALSPEVIAAAMKRRTNTAYKGSVEDRTQGMDWQLAGDAVGGLGDIAGALLREKAIGEAEQGMSPEYAPGRGGIPQSGVCPDGQVRIGC